MEKFILSLTKGDNRTVLSAHDTKEEAIATGEKIFKQLTYGDGILSVIYAEISIENNIPIGKYKLYHSWF